MSDDLVQYYDSSTCLCDLYILKVIYAHFRAGTISSAPRISYDCNFIFLLQYRLWQSTLHCLQLDVICMHSCS